MPPVDEKTLEMARLLAVDGPSYPVPDICQALLDQQAEIEMLRDFAQKCIDITCSVIEGDTRLQSGERLWEYVRSWPHWKDGLLHIDVGRLDAWRNQQGRASSGTT